MYVLTKVELKNVEASDIVFDASTQESTDNFSVIGALDATGADSVQTVADPAVSVALYECGEIG